MLFVFCFNFFSYLILFINFQTNEHISTAPGRELFPPFTISAMEGELEIFFSPTDTAEYKQSYRNDSHTQTHANSTNKALTFHQS